MKVARVLFRRFQVLPSADDSRSEVDEIFNF